MSPVDPILCPKQVGAAFVCARVLIGLRSLCVQDVEKLVPALLKMPFRACRFTYKETAGGPSSSAIRAFFSFLRQNGYGSEHRAKFPAVEDITDPFDVELFVVSSKGVQYCKEIMERYREEYPTGAARLARFLNFRIDDIDQL
jgi:hypothetical protein